MNKSISVGVCSNQLAHKNLKKLAQSLWFIGWPNFEALVGTEDPSQPLVTLVDFI